VQKFFAGQIVPGRRAALRFPGAAHSGALQTRDCSIRRYRRNGPGSASHRYRALLVVPFAKLFQLAPARFGQLFPGRGHFLELLTVRR